MHEVFNAPISSSNTSNHRFLTIDGKTRFMAEWARITGVNIVTIYGRLKRGYSDREAVYGRNPRLRKENARLRQGANMHLLTYQGETHCIAEWAEITGLPPYTIYNRVRMQWPTERILTEPNGIRVHVPPKDKEAARLAMSVGQQRRWARVRAAAEA
jgi:hypothetical protein